MSVADQDVNPERNIQLRIPVKPKTGEALKKDVLADLQAIADLESEEGDDKKV